MELTKNRYSQSLHFRLKDYVMALLMLLFTATASAQFSVTVVASTPETCPGNGTITLAAQNADASAAVNYLVYLLPDTTTALWNATNPNITNLTDGTYQVIASQIINGNTVTTPPQQVVIADNTIVVTYTCTPSPTTCGPNGSIAVTVTNGTAVSYEIIAGPITKPPQPSNILTGLPAGTYTVRVNDACGYGVPQTHTVASNEPALNVSPASFPDIALPACDLVTAKHVIVSQTSAPITYPITAVYTVYPPGGGTPVVFTINIPAGDPSLLEFAQVIPLYYDQDYHYTLLVTDACNNPYNSTHNVHIVMDVSAGYDSAGCPGKLLLITPVKFVPPYTVNFTSTPPDFIPLDENPGHPGPFFPDVLSYGEEGNAVPYGTYMGTITDACGRTDSFEVTIIDQDVTPVVSVFAADCVDQLGKVEISIPGIVIGSAEITVAPDDYEALNSLPDDIMEFYEVEEELMITIDDLPVGNYVVELIDECGVPYDPIPFEIVAASPDPVGSARPDCTEGMGTFRISSLSPPISAVEITAAPQAFIDTLTDPLPYDVSFNIYTNGSFYMDNLPPGSYTFKVTDDCATKTITKTVTGYAVLANDMTISLQCGSFDLYLAHNSTANASLGFWLQKYNPVTGLWGHPGTGEPYTEGTMPEAINSYSLSNNATNQDIPYFGDFRILKTFTTYASGSVDKEKTCIEAIQPLFEVVEGVIIESVVKISCDGEALADVQVNAIGAEPLNYVITEKNGQPFTINNGTDDIFEDLEVGEYKVVVSDLCGYSTPHNFNINDLPSIVIANQPGNMGKCDTGNDNQETFDLSAQTPVIMGQQNPDNVTVTYHSSLADAEAGINPLPLNYTTGGGTVYASVINSVNLNCQAITSFEITLSEEPELNMADIWPMCEGSVITVIADSGYASYEWSTGATTQFITVNQGGPYWVKVTTAENCSIVNDIMVVASAIPHISHVNITDWTNNDNIISVIVEPSAQPQNFQYSLDGVTYQNDPNFYGLATGAYTVYVKDIHGCGIDDQDVYLLSYPKFFTPNGDNINDTWRIQYSMTEPNMMVYIFDRYGKIITSFGATSNGWDGTYNGAKLPATDYWFIVKRENGQEMKGHFAMVR